jgi:hypothetical protein
MTLVKERSRFMEKDGSIATQDLINRCCSIKNKEELDVELSFFVHAASMDKEYG